MWILNVILVVALGANAFARPQGGSFEVDGFVFDGPADRPPFRPTSSTGPISPTGPTPTTQGSLRSSSTTESPATTSSATTALPNARFNSCVASCLVTPEYNPVCGTDLVMYNNPGALNCASFCGKAVTLNYYGPCTASSLRG